MTKQVLDERIAKVRQARAAAHADIRELAAQINALNGREAELTELLALLEPDGQPQSH